jgi:transposase
MKNITQDMLFRQSLIKYAEKFGVSKASIKHNKSRSYIYFWKARYDGSLESLACQSRKPHGHPNQHTEEEITLICNLKRRNPTLGLTELWLRAKQRGYSRRPESMFRLMRRLGLIAEPPPKKKYIPKPYEQMQYPGQRVQIDVKVVPRACITNPQLRLFQYTAIDEYSRLRFLGAYDEQSTYSSADFLKRTAEFFARRGVKLECVQTDNGFEFTNRLNNKNSNRQTLFEKTAADMGIRNKFIRPYTPRHNGKVERSHREDQKLFYDSHRFYSLADFDAQLNRHQARTNNRPMRPLKWASPRVFFSAYNVQYV